MIRTSLLTILAAGVAIAFAAPVSAQTNFSRDDVRTKRDQEIEQRRSTRDERQQQFRDTRDSRLGTYQGNFQDKKKKFRDTREIDPSQANRWRSNNENALRNSRQNHKGRAQTYKQNRRL
jgi:hypothetical protein